MEIFNILNVLIHKNPAKKFIKDDSFLKVINIYLYVLFVKNKQCKKSYPYFIFNLCSPSLKYNLHEEMKNVNDEI